MANIFDDVDQDDEIPSPPAPPVRDDFDKHGNNPPTTRALETRNEMVPGTAAPAPQVQLMSVFGDDGKVRVCKTVNGKQVEQWRAPTAEEWQLLKERGRFVRGGLADAPVVAPPTAPAPAPGGAASIMPKLLIGGALVAAAGAAFYFWRQHKEMEENVEEMD